MHDNFLPRHSYPLHIKLFCFSLVLLFLYVTPTFLCTEFKKHRDVKNKMNEAEDCFIHKDYFNALRLYSFLCSQYNSLELARTRTVQSCFALVNTDPEFYDYGLSFLKNKKFKNSEIDELAFYLPNEHQKNEFKSIFVEA